MTPAEVTKLRAQLRREMEAGDMISAEQTAMRLAPFEERLCAELDADPAAIVPAWSTCA